MRATPEKQFSPNINHSITKAEFHDFIANYCKIHGAETSVFFDANAVQGIISQKGAAGCRYYYAVYGGIPTLVLIGTNPKGHDLIGGKPLVSLPNPPLTIDSRYNPLAVDHDIELAEAAALTANYQKRINPRQVKGGFFGKRAIQEILRQKNCIGIRFWFGAKQNGVPVIALSGVDNRGKDLLDGNLAEMSLLCPPYCDASLNPLNNSIYHERQIELAAAEAIDSIDEALKRSA